MIALGKLWFHRSGEAAVEFALVALALLVFVFCVVELGRMLWTWQALQSTAADTARCIAIGSNRCSNPQDYAISVATSRGVTSLTAAEITVTFGATCAGQSNFAQVSITHAYATLLPKFLSAPSAGIKASACYPNNP